MEWIKVTERLPDLEENVLLFDKWKSKDGTINEDQRIGYLREFTTRKSKDGTVHSCEWGGTEFSFNITHWMPLPTPPID